MIELLFIKKLDDEAHGEREQKGEATCSLVLMPGSLLVFKDSAYAGQSIHDNIH